MIDDDDFVDEILYSIKVQDAIKIKVLLQEIGNVSPKAAQRLLFEMNRADELFTIPILIYFQVQTPDVMLAIPALSDTLSNQLEILTQCEEVYEKLPSKEERYFFIESLTDSPHQKTTDFLIALLRSEVDQELIRSVMRTMEELKQPEFAEIAMDFLYAEDFSLVLQVIETLGSCVTVKGINALEGKAGSDLAVDRKIVLSLTKAGTKEAIDCLVGFLARPAAYLRNFARAALVQFKERSVQSLVPVLETSSDKDVKILCLNTLGETGCPEAVKPVRKFLQGHPEDANVRFAAYEALGLLPVKAGAYTLTDGLSDPEASVRMAAAKAVDHLFDDMFKRGIVNLLDHHEHPEQIVEAFLVAECDKVYLSLMDHEPFMDLAFELLRKNEFTCQLEHFIPLDDSGELNGMLSPDALAGTEGDFQVCIVDDSRLLLKIYKKMFAELDVTCHLFEYAEAGLEFIREMKPSLVLTDLNMPGMDGIVFTQKIREIYSATELPVVMVTTQEEGSAKVEGVQCYLQKPFTEEMLAELVCQYGGG